jgi:hypothetical protein
VVGLRSAGPGAAPETCRCFLTPGAFTRTVSTRPRGIAVPLCVCVGSLQCLGIAVFLPFSSTCRRLHHHQSLCAHRAHQASNPFSRLSYVPSFQMSSPPLLPSPVVGSIITEAFASTMPTMVAYVIDTPRCAAPQTFMTNMLQVGD